jgi:hypothetical protein
MIKKGEGEMTQFLSILLTGFCVSSSAMASQGPSTGVSAFGDTQFTLSGPSTSATAFGGPTGGAGVSQVVEAAETARQICVPQVGASRRAPCVAAAETVPEIWDCREQLDQTDRCWTDRYQRMRLTVAEDGTSPRHIELEMHDLKQAPRQQKTLVTFLSPADKAGIRLLGHVEGGKPARQWLYTPASPRVREIAKSARMNRFDITDFTYHDLDVLTDMPHWKEADARLSLAKPETIDGVLCHVIDLEPKLDYVAYGRIRVWLGQADLVARQVEFYEKPPQRGFFARLFGRASASGDQPVRRFRQRDIRYVGPIPVAHRIEVDSPADHSRTSIEVVDVTFNRGLPKAFFGPENLGRLR